MSEPTERLFVYATLKDERVVKEVLGHKEVETKATAPNYSKMDMLRDGEKWPTIVWVGERHGGVDGDIMMLTRGELHKIDRWERDYTRIRVKTSAGDAWAYVYTRWGKERDHDLTT